MFETLPAIPAPTDVEIQALPVSGRVTTPGFYRMSAEAYHADPAPVPSLSSSVAKLFLEQTPQHAYQAHPRLAPKVDEESSSKMDIGTVGHALLTGRGRDIVTVVADDWRTKAAREARDAARASGKVAVLEHQLDAAIDMVKAARAFLAQVEGCEQAFAEGQGEGELVGIWQDVTGSWGRMMVDWTEGLASQAPILWDYKTTGTSANPAEVSRLFASMGYEVSASFYTRGFSHLRPETLGRVEFRWLVQEIEPPFACSIIRLGTADRHVADRKVAYAFERWARCLREGTFPGYPAGICEIELPFWHTDKWVRREVEEEELRAAGADPFLTLSRYAIPYVPPKPLTEPV